MKSCALNVFFNECLVNSMLDLQQATKTGYLDDIFEEIQQINNNSIVPKEG